MRSDKLPDADLIARINSVDWYHTIKLGQGITTPGQYDHQPYLHYYRFPDSLRDTTVLDVGAASGFLSFEFERRGAQVTATDLPNWFDHDFGANYMPDQTLETGNTYLHQPFEIAKEALGSQVHRQALNIYDLSPNMVGMFDLVFCGSLLIHLTDPIRGLTKLASVTKHKAIIATLVSVDEAERSIAHMIGHQRGDGWWIPTRACLELMAVCAGFVAIEWVSEFRIDQRDGSPGPYHGVITCV